MWLQQAASSLRCCCRRLLSTAAEGDFPVVIAGAGPTGLTLSLLLSRLGVRSLVLEQAPALTTHPQAHFINNRTMEVFRPLQGLAAEVAAASPPLAEWRKFVYCESMTGNVLGEVDHFQGQEGPQMPELSPEPLAHVSQHRLLPLLAARVARQGSLSRLRFGQEVQAVRQSADGVELSVRGADGAASTVRCSFLVAADGARSPLRAQLGVQMQGDAALQHLLNIHFFAPGLWDALARRPAMLYFVFNPRTVAVVVAHSLQHGEFVAQVPFFPPLQRLADFTPAACTAMVRDMIGSATAEVDIAAVRSWTMRAQVAESFQVGRVFLAGDAAHRFPPAGGFGMNTGIQDAHNLAWKLAAVLQGVAGQQLLGSYEAERRPVAIANTALSVANYRDAIRVPQMLGLDPRAANLLNTTMTAAASVLPAGIAASALEAGLSFGRRASALGGPVRRWRRAQVARFLKSGAALRLQYPKEDLGFTYGPVSGAICAEAEQDSRPHPSAQDDRGAPYLPTTRPGARLPHCWLHTSDGERLSTLDLLAGTDVELLLLLGASPAAAAWAAAALQLAELKMMAVAPNEAAARQLQQQVGGDGRIRVAVDGEGRWRGLREVSEDGAILVRPDGHIAWRIHAMPYEGAGDADLVALLQALLQGVVGRVYNRQ